MANPDDFRAAFAQSGVVAFPPAAVSVLPIAAADADWLTTVGLPRSAAPFLSFGSEFAINIPTVSELWGIEDGSRHRVIGTNGSGDPVAIDTATAGEVVYLNHDNDFQRVLINSTVTQLAETLLLYHRMVAEAVVANGPEAYLHGEIPPESLRSFVSLLRSLDPPAAARGMWVEEVEQLEARAAEG